MSAPSYEQTVDVETPELVVLTYSIAGIGSRAMAAITDLLLVAAAFVAARHRLVRSWSPPADSPAST